MNSSDLLAAGAIVPVDASLPEDVPTDLVSARSYRSPVLGDRVVVRLTADSLAPGDDLAMEFLGMSAPEVVGPIGRQRRRALGFPGWALIHDPGHAAFALEVVKEFKKHARRASSKPGFAKDGFDEIGVRLGRSVPHFLPSYWEEVGRAFLEVGSTTYAAQAFNKAREAERVHALDVDESLRSETFLEFALAGALAVKALGAYAKDLAAAYEPAVAYGHFRELCLRRTLGGIPPWSQMGTELRRLMRGAKIKHGPEEESLARDLLAASSLSKAPVGFWKHFAPAYAAVAGADPAVRGTLLNLFPGQNEKSAYYEQWLDLLDGAGSLDGVMRPATEVPEEAAPAESAAAWLHRAMESMTGWWNSGYPHRLFEVARRMAPRLLADGVPVDVCVNHNVHLDMADLLLELGVPVANPHEHASVDFRRWARQEDDGADRLRQLDHVAADERFVPLLRTGLDDVFGEDVFEAAAAGKSGLYAARAEWLASRTKSLTDSLLPDFQAAVATLISVLRESIAEEFPDAVAALGEVDAVAALAATWRTGVVDEFGWPAFEAVVDALRAEDGKKIFVSGAFPTLVVASTKRCIALDATGKIAEHELRLPKGADLRILRYVGGQFLVLFGDIWRPKFYWSDSPQKVHDFDGYFYSRDHPADAVGIEVAGGGVSEGGRAIRPGDSKPQDTGQNVYSDGDTFWWYGWNGSRHSFFEMDPKTGEKGRQSWPAFFEDFGKEGTELQSAACSLYPVPDTAEDSPLGPRGGFYGWRVRCGDGDTECEGMDGRSLRASASTDFAGLLTWPSGSGLPVSTGQWPSEVVLWDPAGEVRVAACELDNGYRGAPRHVPGQAASLPLPWWHYFRGRDTAGSRALRTVSDEIVGHVLGAARLDIEAADSPSDCAWDLALDALATHLPEVTDPRLRCGLAGLAGLVALDEHNLRAKVTEVGGTGEAPTAALDTFVLSGTARERFPHLELELEPLVHLGASAFCAALDRTDGTASQVAQLKVAARSALGTLDIPMRYLTGEWPDPPSKPDMYHLHWWGFVENGNRYVVRIQTQWGGNVEYQALELALSGSFAPLAGTTIGAEAGGSWRGPAVAEFVELLGERGPLPLIPEVGPILAAETGLSANAAMLLWLGAPGVDAWAKNFLDKDLREALGWKVKDAEQARVEIKGACDRGARQKIYELAMPPKPADLWDPIASGAVNRFAEALAKVVGTRVSVDGEVVADAARRLDGWTRKSAEVLPGVVAPDGTALSRDGAWRVLFDDGSFEVENTADGECFEGGDVGNAAHYVPFLFQLPVGHAMRAAVPRYLALVRERLAHPEFLVEVESDYLWGTAAEMKAKVDKHMGAYHGEPYELRLSDGGGAVNMAGLHAVETGAVIAAGYYDPTGQNNYGRLLLVARLRALMESAEELARFAGNQVVTGARLVESSGFTALAERIESTPLAAGQYEQNPLLSAPELVADVAATLSVGEEAACAYLQLLTLMEPTTRNLRIWNDWTAARLKKALEPLVEAGLVLEAKRARAGRSHFLPGGWVTRSAPKLPYESWKAPLYGIEEGNGPLDAYLPLEPFHALFAKAWARVVDGDKPDYEEV